MSDQLAAIDDALDTGAADHSDPLTRELQELALMLQADAPEPDAEFRGELGRKVAERLSEAGFAAPAGLAACAHTRFRDRARRSADRADRDSRRRVWRPRSRRWRGIERRRRRGRRPGASAPAIVAPKAPAERSQFERAADQAAAGSGRAVPIPPDGGFAPGQRSRKIERTIGLELEMPVDEMARVAEQVTTVTNRHGGFVLSSSVSTGGDSAGGDFELRIPSPRLRPALRDLAALADVRTQTQSGRDVTREHVTTKDRLRAARAERRSLLRRLELATTDEDAEAIRRQLDLVSGEISRLRGQMRGLHLRTDYAVVTVSLLPKDEDQGGGAGGSFDDALGDAGALLVGVAGVIVRVVAVALPLGLIALVGWLAGRAFTRRRRESALA